MIGVQCPDGRSVMVEGVETAMFAERPEPKQAISLKPPFLERTHLTVVSELPVSICEIVSAPVSSLRAQDTYVSPIFADNDAAHAIRVSNKLTDTLVANSRIP